MGALLLLYGGKYNSQDILRAFRNLRKKVLCDFNSMSVDLRYTELNLG